MQQTRKELWEHSKPITCTHLLFSVIVLNVTFQIIFHELNYEPTRDVDDQNSGYMAPEYAMEGLFSVKSDVFSFGVIMLEIIIGKRNSGFYMTELAPTLLAYVILLFKRFSSNLCSLMVGKSICNSVDSNHDRHGDCGMKEKNWTLWIQCYWNHVMPRKL